MLRSCVTNNHHLLNLKKIIFFFPPYKDWNINSLKYLWNALGNDELPEFQRECVILLSVLFSFVGKKKSPKEHVLEEKKVFVLTHYFQYF